MEQEAARKLDLMGRLGQRRPDVKTIADCRRDHGPALKRVCREGTLRCQALDRCGGELIAIDGSTWQAANGPKRHFSGSQRGRLSAEIDATLAADLPPLDRQDAAETPLRTPTAAPLQPKLEPWPERASRVTSATSRTGSSAEPPTGPRRIPPVAR